MPVVGSTNRIYQLTLSGSHGTAEVISTWSYRISSLLQPSALSVAEAFRDEVLPAIVVPLMANMIFTNIEVIDVLDIENFASLPVTETGDRTVVDALTAFIVYSLKLVRSSRDMRSGWKRFSGLGEADVAGAAFAAGFIAFVDSVSADIIQPLNIDLAVLPLTLVRSRPTPNSPLIDPDDPTTWLYSDVAGVEFPNRVTTQNSRKQF